MSVEELEMMNAQHQRRYNRMGWKEGSNQTRVIVAEDPEHPINNAQVAVKTAHRKVEELTQPVTIIATHNPAYV